MTTTTPTYTEILTERMNAAADVLTEPIATSLFLGLHWCIPIVLLEKKFGVTATDINRSGIRELVRDARRYRMFLSSWLCGRDLVELPDAPAVQRFEVGDRVRLLTKPTGHIASGYPLTVGSIYTVLDLEGSNLWITSDEPGRKATCSRSRFKWIGPTKRTASTAAGNATPGGPDGAE